MARLDNVKCMWAQVQQPDTRFEPAWHITAVLTKEHQEQLTKESKAVDPKGKGIKFKQDEQGNTIFRFRRRVARADGNGENNPPLVCGPKGKDDLFTHLIGNGSIVNIQYSFVPYKNKFGEGLTHDLKGVQVISHIPFGTQDGDEFDTVSSPSGGPEETSNEYNDDDF